jgi:hypothetical protein
MAQPLIMVVAVVAADGTDLALVVWVVAELVRG